MVLDSVDDLFDELMDDFGFDFKSSDILGKCLLVRKLKDIFIGMIYDECVLVWVERVFKEKEMYC